MFQADLEKYILKQPYLQNKKTLPGGLEPVHKDILEFHV